MLDSGNLCNFTFLKKKCHLGGKNCFCSVRLLLVWIVMVHCTGGVQSQADCQDMVSLALEAEQCIDPMETLSNISVVGSLTREQWSFTCKAYYNSLQCIQRLHQRCEKAPVGSLDIGTNLQSVLQAGLGQLCVDTNSFVAYQSHEDCFMTHTAAVKRCKETFYTDMAILLHQITEVPPDQFKHSLCTQYNIFLTCIEDSLTGPCGQHAAQLYCGLLNAQVPVRILSLCNLKPEQSKAAEEQHTTSAGSPLRHCLLSLVLSTIIIFLNGTLL